MPSQNESGKQDREEDQEDQEEEVSTYSELKDKLEEVLPHFVRPAWTPNCPSTWNRKPCEEEEDLEEGVLAKRRAVDQEQVCPFASKFGGVDPWLGRGEEWPRCRKAEKDGGCGARKSFICQLVVQDLPREMKKAIGRESGLFRCFACLDCMNIGGDSADAAFFTQEEVDAGNTLKSLCARTALKHRDKIGERFREELPKTLAAYVDRFDVDAGRDEDGDEEEPMSKKARRDKDPVERFEEHRVLGWNEIDSELPGPFEMDDYEEEIKAKISVGENYFEDHQEDSWEYLSRGVKLGGYNLWPFWHNISEPKCYPKCGSCNGTEMNVTFLHLDETAHRRKQKPVLDFEWGEPNGSMGFVSLCPGCKRPAMNYSSI